MYFGYSDEENILKNSVHELFRKQVPIAEVRKLVDEPVISPKLRAMIGEQGLLGVLNSDGERYEGVLMATAILEEAGRVLLPFPLIEGIIAANLLSRDPSKTGLYEDIVAGTQVATFAWHPEGAPRIQETNGKLVAGGSFHGAPFAASAERILAFFEGPKAGETTLIILDRGNPAVSVVPQKGMDVSMPLDRVEVRDLVLADANVVLGLGNGEPLREEAQHLGALFTAAELVGVSEEALGTAVEYTKIRKQFGQEIGRFQALKHMASEMYLLRESSRVAVIYAGWAREAGIEPEAVSIAKAYAADAANEITGQAIQMHGGIGFTWESDVHFYFKRARRSASSFGDSYEHRERVLKAVEARGA